MKAFYSFFVVILAAALLVGCGKSTQPVADTTASTPMDILMSVKQAVEKFNTQEGHFPKTLDELAPKYISKIPDAPSGYHFEYDPATGEVKLGRGQ